MFESQEGGHMEKSKLSPPANTFFAVFFDKEGNVIKDGGVQRADGSPVKVLSPEKLLEKPLQNVNGFKEGLVIFRKGSSPCCYRDAYGNLHCWPPCV
jgi:hypothetical protein